METKLQSGADHSRRASPSQPVSLRASHTVGVLGIALALRLLVLWTVVSHYSAQWFFARGMEMQLIARSLLAGHGFASPFGGTTGLTAFVAPIYPILVAIVFKLFGELTLASAVTIIGAQILLNLFTIWLIMHVARQLFHQAAATIAGLIWACSLPLIWVPTICWETSLSCFLLVGFLALVLKYRVAPSLRTLHWICLGAYCGVTGLINPALLPAIFAIALWLVASTYKRAGLSPLLAALTFVIVYAPWPVRNAHAFHAFIPLRTTVGFELWMGNRPGADGFLNESLFPTFNQAELADYQAHGEVAYTAHKSELAKAYIVAHPAVFARLSALRALRFWSGTGTRNGSAAFALHAASTTLLGFTGIWLLYRRRRYAEAFLFLLPIAIFPLPYIITHAEFRYRIVLDPVMAIISGYGITELYRLAIRRRSSIMALTSAATDDTHRPTTHVPTAG